MPDGTKDLANLFSRVTALEQADADAEQTVARIVKVYGTLGIRVTVTASLHQYWICGQIEQAGFLSPWFPAEQIITCSEDRII